MITNQIPIEEICRKLKPLLGSKIDKVYLKYLTADSRETKEEIASVLNTLYQRYLSQLLSNKIILTPPTQDFIDGDYPLAKTVYAGKETAIFNLREQDWPRHICVSGMSGSGKTTFAFNILENFLKKDKPFLVFDWKKSFRPLLKADPRILCFTVGNDSLTNDLRFNINVPPKGIAPKEWIITLTDLLTESFQASFGVHKVILETLDEAFKEWGIYNGSENYPTWNHIKWNLEQKMNKSKSREEGWLESALRIATVLTFGEFGKILTYKGNKSIPIDELMNKKVLLELNALGNVEKKFFCEFVLTYLFKQKKAMQNNIGNGFDHAILVDEAHNIFLKKPTNFSNESVTDMIYREMREYGTSLICLDQHISKISDTVKGNSACHVIFQQQLPEDIITIANITNLSDKKEIFSQLEVGTAVVKLSERYTEPFMVKVPMNNLRRFNVSDEDIKTRMSTFDMYKNEFDNEAKQFKTQNLIDELKKMKLCLTLPTHIAKEREEDKVYLEIKQKLREGFNLPEIEKELSTKYNVTNVMKNINRILDEKLKISPPQEDEKVYKLEQVEASIPQNNLSEDEQKFVNFLVKNPKHNFTTVMLYMNLGFSPRKGNVIKNQLLEKGLIKTEEIKYEKGWKKIIRLSH